MTDDSANRYDTQVEVLFNGTANATRRQALPQLHEVFAGRDQRKLRPLDIGCGTGRFLDFFNQAWPRLPAVGTDMSEPYVRFARRHLKRWSRMNFIVGNAEALPVPDHAAPFSSVNSTPATIRFERSGADCADCRRCSVSANVSQCQSAGDYPKRESGVCRAWRRNGACACRANISHGAWIVTIRFDQ